MKTIRIKPPKSLVGRLLQAGACILFLTLIGGCMGNYGSYNRDSEVFEVFNNDQVPLDYRYYYYHSGSHPIAVIGVEKKYDAGSTMWHEVEPNTEKFKDLVEAGANVLREDNEGNSPVQLLIENALSSPFYHNSNTPSIVAAIQAAHTQYPGVMMRNCSNRKNPFKTLQKNTKDRLLSYRCLPK